MTHFPIIVVLNKSVLQQDILKETVTVDEKSKALWEGTEQMLKRKHGDDYKPQKPPLQYIEHINIKPKLDELLAELLAPFDESKDVEPYRDEDENYMDEYKSFIKEVKNGEGWVVRTANQDLEDELKQNKKSIMPKPEHVVYAEHKETTKKYKKIINKVNADEFSFVDWFNWYHDGDTKYDPKDYQRMSTYNPESKWDWYQIGGRWRDWIKDKNGASKNIMRVGDLGVEIMELDQLAIYKGKYEIMRKIMMKEVSEKEAEKLRFETLGFFEEEPKPINPIYEERPRKHAKCKKCGHKPNEFKMGGGKCEDGKCDFSPDSYYKHLVSCAGIEPFEDYYKRLYFGFSTNVLVYWDHSRDKPIWMERGRFGWWGIHEKNEEMSEKNWYKMFHEKLKAFDPKTPMVLVDCHI